MNRKGYHKNETCSRNHFEFQHEVFLKFCDCMHIIFFPHMPSSRLAGQTFIINQILIYALGKLRKSKAGEIHISSISCLLHCHLIDLISVQQMVKFDTNYCERVF